jgi:tetratricopeptide (TPR) repeat protein/O-antigen ligase
MHTRLSRFSESIIESSWLATLIIVPLFINVYSQRVFEEDKIPLFRSIAVVSLVFALIWVVERRKDIWQSPSWSFLRFPMVLPCLTLALIYTLTAFSSVAPQISFWGAHIRMQGTYTNISYMLIFLLILLTLRSSAQVDRLVTVVLMTSIPVSLYGIFQYIGLDPLSWNLEGRPIEITRITSTAGNPIFLSAYLIMLLPISCIRVVEYIGRLARSEAMRTYKGVAGTLGFLSILLIQLLAVLLSGSRGPVVGILVALFFFGVLYALYRRRLVLILTTVALAMVSLAFLVVFNLPKSPLESLRDKAFIGRYGRVFDASPGTTGRVRVLIWSGVLELFASNPLRALIGSGPETLMLVIQPFCPVELNHMTGYRQLPDRSHNETLDSIVMTGLLGFVAQMIVFVSIFFYVLKWLGMIRKRKDAWIFLVFNLGCGTVGWFLPYLLRESFVFSGLTLPAGMIVGMSIYLFWFALNIHWEPREGHPNDLLLIALFSSIVGHFIEIQFGIAVAATRLQFWVFSALAVVLGTSLIKDSRQCEEVPQSSSQIDSPEEQNFSQPSFEGAPIRTSLKTDLTLSSLSVLMGFLLSVLIVDFVVLEPEVSRSIAMIPWLFGLSFLLGGTTIICRPVSYDCSNGRGWGDWAILAAIALTSSLLYLLLHCTWIAWALPSQGVISPNTLAIPSRRANIIVLFYIWCFFMIGVNALVLTFSEPKPERFSSSGPFVFAFTIMTALCVPLIVRTNLNISRANMYLKEAHKQQSYKRLDVAIELFQKASSMQPKVDHYLTKLGQAYMEKAKKDVERKEIHLRKSLHNLSKARDLNPLNVDNTGNLAALHLMWGDMEKNPEEKKHHLNLADELYSRAIQVWPNNADLWNRWASVARARGRMETARDRLEYSLSMDPKFDDTYELFGKYYAEDKNWDLAVVFLNKAIELNPKDSKSWIRLGYAQMQSGDLQTAIESNRKALRLGAEEFLANRNLAYLYGEIGNLEKALNHAEQALKLAPDNELAATLRLFLRLTENFEEEGKQ